MYYDLGILPGQGPQKTLMTVIAKIIEPKATRRRFSRDDAIALLAFLLFTAGWFALSSMALAQDTTLPPPQLEPAEFFDQPVLRIQTKQHTSRIFRLAVDAEQRYLVTGSTDKTVRVWSLPDMKLQSILRVPIGPAQVGQIHALAISPDARLIAVGGPNRGKQGEDVVYIFDRESARVIASLAVPLPARELTFSDNGRVLGAALGSGSSRWRGGVVFWNTRRWKVIRQHADYQGEAYGLVFDKDGRAFTTSMDGLIREYDESGLLAKQVRTESGRRPLRLSISPEGDLLAVTYQNAAAVDVYDSADLALRFSPDTPTHVDVMDESFSSTGWSADGKVLFAGGIYAADRASEQALTQIQSWDTRSEDGFSDVRRLDYPIIDFVTLPQNGLAFAGFGPSFGIVDAAGEIRNQGPDKLDFRYGIDGISVSADGATIFLSFANVEVQTGFYFDVSRRLLSIASAGEPSSKPARIEASAFDISDWRNSYYPKFNGSSIDLDEFEKSLSLAIANDEQFFALGTEWNLRLFDRSGEELWSVPVPEFAEHINIPEQGNFVIAALDDGTIRWYDIENGTELLSLFVHPEQDKSRWVLWTPSGFYDASVGGDRLLGWHVNRSAAEEALFYSASRFSDLYYRPDLVANVLQTSEVPPAPAAEAITGNLPPFARILEIEDGRSGFLNVKYEVFSPSGQPILNVYFTAGGRRYSLADLGESVSEVRQNVAQEVQVPFFEGDQDIQIVAETGTMSSDFSGRGILPASRATAQRPKPSLYAVVIGISDYENPGAQLDDLEYADDDAVEVSAILRSQQNNNLYASANVRPLVNGQATRARILETLRWLRDAPTENDISIVYIAGHGLNDWAPGQSDTETRAGDYYFLPYEARVSQLVSTGVAGDSILRLLRQTKGVRLLFFDTCQSGNVDNAGLVNLLSDGTGAIVYSSSAANTPSYESSQWGGHGAFTSAFLNGISGSADGTTSA
jgi:WD40 repeat protein